MRYIQFSNSPCQGCYLFPLGQGCALPTELFPQISSKFTRFSAALGIKASSSALAGTKIPHYCIFFFGEEDETRTHTTQRSLPPQSSASTNSATSPFHKTIQCNRCPEQDSNLHVSQHSHLKRARLPFRHLGIKHARVHSLKERKTRLELATPTLARLCSTN